MQSTESPATALAPSATLRKCDAIDTLSKIQTNLEREIQLNATVSKLSESHLRDAFALEWHERISRKQ